MTQDEFNALKPGDKVRNSQGHEALVVHSGDYGKRIQWNENGPLFTLLARGRTWVNMEAVPALPDDVSVDTNPAQPLP